jgi:tetratricopeptide (TPR) repeat protein
VASRNTRPGSSGKGWLRLLTGSKSARRDTSSHFQPRSQPFKRLLNRIESVAYWTLRAIEGFFATLIYPFQTLFTRYVLRPLREWQLAAEERRNRKAKVSVISKLLHRFRYRVWRWSERLEKHSALFRRIMAPFRYVARIPARFSRTIANGYETLENRLAKSKWMKWLYVLMRGTRQATGWSYEFGRSWFVSRDYRLLLGGIPAFLMFCPLAYCMVRVSLQSPVATAQRYRMAAIDAREAKQYELAQLCNRKIQQMGLFVESSLYDMAVNTAAQGDTDSAIKQMQSLVADYDFFPARLWLVQRLMAGEVVDDAEEAFGRAQDHLDTILRIDDRNLGARYLQASLWSRQGRAPEAIQLLLEISREYPPANVLLASIQRQQGQGQDAAKRLQMALKYFEDRSQGDMTPQDYLSWANALAESGAMDQAEKRLEEALELYADENNFPVDAAKAFSQLAARVGAFQPAEYLRLMKRAVELDAKDEYLLMLTYAVEKPESSAGAIAFFQERAKAAPLSVDVETTLGVQAYQRKDYAASRAHFERVMQLDKKNAGAANNLAWLLSETEPVDLERAYLFANVAVQSAPDRAIYRDTRGQILTKLGRWQEAASDLEYAVNGMTVTAQTHRSLATVYERLGNNELAAAHRRSATTQP